VKLQRVSSQPILIPRQHIPWESDAICNAAAVLADGKVHLFYRAISHPGWSKQGGGTYDSCIGYAVSDDGIHFERLDEPVFKNNDVRDGHKIDDPEDPRITVLEGRYYMTYCNWDGRWCQTCLASSDDLENWTNHGVVVPCERFGMNKNAALFPEKIGGRYAMLHRPEPMECFDPTKQFDWYRWTRDVNIPGGIRLSFSDDLKTWSYEPECVLLPRAGSWDCTKVGMAGPPIKTENGWLIVYHATDEDQTYRLGLALLDLANPFRVLKRCDEPILEPELEWERVGDIPNVVFSCGHFLIGAELWVYYGGADRVIGLARGNVCEFICGPEIAS